ncbi:MAG: hypothetical protein JSV58_05470 [Candidatus Bathyarchaeota archaeon]|nr:MAG: hypothetical protein JSV58_05470 [Candidatus Bathyarchaeota archaeon]
MCPETTELVYPYPRNRVFLSAIITVLSVILAVTLLLEEPSSMLLVISYIFSTIVVTVLTYFMKERLYPFLAEEKLRGITDKEKKVSQWKMLIVAFFMLIGSILVPLLLAGILSEHAWFIMITSFTAGVSISELMLYFRFGSNR